MENGNPQDKVKPSRLAIFAAAILLLISLVSKAKFGEFEFAGGATFAGLAALLILWPVLRQVISQGGSAEILGLKLQVNTLERKAEQDYALRIQELRADLEELRARVGPAASELSKPIVDPKIFESAVTEYTANRENDKWRERVEVDKRLAAGAGRFPVSFLRQSLVASSESREVGMAVGVCLGLPYPGDDDIDAALLLAELLGSKFERVRYRAALSAERRGRRSDISDKARAILAKSLEEALRIERSSAVLKVLQDALKAFS
jgi:hypothetical protein